MRLITRNQINVFEKNFLYDVEKPEISSHKILLSTYIHLIFAYFEN